MKKPRPKFGPVPGYVEPRNISSRPPSTTALPDEVKVSERGARAAFLKERLQVATAAGKYVTVPDLADELLGGLEVSATSRKRLLKKIREWLHKKKRVGLVEQVKDLIAAEHQGTDGWRWNPVELGGPRG
jgi:hypothetical protein